MFGGKMALGKGLNRGGIRRGQGAFHTTIGEAADYVFKQIQAGAAI